MDVPTRNGWTLIGTWAKILVKWLRRENPRTYKIDHKIHVLDISLRGAQILTYNIFMALKQFKPFVIHLVNSRTEILPHLSLIYDTNCLKVVLVRSIWTELISCSVIQHSVHLYPCNTGWSNLPRMNERRFEHKAQKKICSRISGNPAQTAISECFSSSPDIFVDTFVIISLICQETLYNIVEVRILFLKQWWLKWWWFITTLQIKHNDSNKNA